MTTKKEIKAGSPLGQLILEKRQLRRQCRLQEEILNAEWDYVREHAGHLLWSEVKTMLHPHHHKTEKGDEGKGIAHLLGGNAHVASMAWGMAKSMLMQWLIGAGWKGMKHLFRRKVKTA